MNFLWNINLWLNNLILLKFLDENTILVPTFWGHSQIGPYILGAINLALAIFKPQSI